MKTMHRRLAKLKRDMRSRDMGWPTGDEIFGVLLAATPTDAERARAAIAPGRMERVDSFLADALRGPGRAQA